MSSLQDQLNAAREAARQVAEADALRRMADQVPELEQKIERDRQRKKAEENLALAKERARYLLEAAKPGVEGWSARFEAVIMELEALINELPHVQEPILRAGRTLRLASHDMALFSEAYAQLGELAGDDMERYWREVGGLDTALNVFPEQPPSEFYRKTVQSLKLPAYRVDAWRFFF
jgi:hypothetical protein